MGIFDALNTSVGGLQAQSFALQNISGNIANASTTGYKGIGTSFEDLIPDATTPSRQVAGGVTAFAQATITTQGTVSASTVATNMAINGDGFFSVQKSTAVVDNVPVFSGVTDYTRRGDFQLNANGNLINGAGYYLMGVTVDPKTGNVLGNVPQVLQFQNNFVPAQATSAIQYAANLPTTPTTPASSASAIGTITAVGGLNPADFATNPLPTAQPFFTDGAVTGAAVNNKLTVPAAITTATLLSGGANSNSLATNFAVNDQIKLTGSAGDIVTFTFVASGATGNQINVADVVGTLLGKIGAVTGVAPTISARRRNHAALRNRGELGASAAPRQLSPPATRVHLSGGAESNHRVGGRRRRHRQRPDHLHQRIDQRRRGHRLSMQPARRSICNCAGPRPTVPRSAPGTPTPGICSTRPTRARPAPRPAWVNVGTNFTFDANGTLSSPIGSSITIPNVTVDGQSLGNLSPQHQLGRADPICEHQAAPRPSTPSRRTAIAAGQLQSVAVNNNGLVVGTFSNGQNLDLAQVTLSHFNGTNYLKALDGGAYAVTDLSGPRSSAPRGKISGSSLEGSNTDIADEFTKLIVTQQAYSANTKVITTANNMVQDLLNVLR